jgi:hypothetical protein
MRITVKSRRLTTLRAFFSVCGYASVCLFLQCLRQRCLYGVLFERVKRDREENDAFHQKGDASDLG